MLIYGNGGPSFTVGSPLDLSEQGNGHILGITAPLSYAVEDFYYQQACRAAEHARMRPMSAKASASMPPTCAVAPSA